jgi:hypothetical protein
LILCTTTDTVVPNPHMDNVYAKGKRVVAQVQELLGRLEQGHTAMDAAAAAAAPLPSSDGDGGPALSLQGWLSLPHAPCGAMRC